MRRVLFFMMVSLDGYFEGDSREIDWHNTDEEFNDFAIAQLSETDTLLFGRVTYELMASYWPLEAAIRDDPVIAEKMNVMQKIVFSKTLTDCAWQNTRLVKQHFAAEVMKLKQQPGRDMIMLGSSRLAVMFLEHSLLDEIRIMVNPVVLGRGQSVFRGINDRLRLKLVRTRTFLSGNVLLYYEPVKRRLPA